MDVILQSLIKYFKNDRNEAYDTLEDFVKCYSKKPKQALTDLKKLISQDCSDNNLCPNCYIGLSVKREVANQLEYQGQPCQEFRDIKYCECCNWTNENEE